MIYSPISVVLKSFNLLSDRDKKLLLAVTCLQIIFGFLDLLGVALVGAVGALSVTGLESKSPGNRVSELLRAIGIGELQLQNQVAILGILAASFLIIKTLLSMYFTKRSLAFLSIRSAEFGAKLARKIFSQEYSGIKSRSNQDNLFHLTSGSNSLILGVLGATVSIISDGALISVMLIGLTIVEPSIALACLIFFSAIGILLNLSLSSKAQKLGTENANLTVRVNEFINETLDTYREQYVRNIIMASVSAIEKSRKEISQVTSRISFLPYVSKYVLESSVVLGSFILAAYQFTNQEAGRAIGNLALFLVAGSRIAPAILRLQQGYIQIRVSSGAAIPTLELFNSLKNDNFNYKQIKTNIQDFKHSDFSPEIIIKDLNFSYPHAESQTISNLNLKIDSGMTVALVGKSGAGKSTIADLLLGVLIPSSGEVLISGKNPQESITTWPGAISYVPQDVAILSSTIAQNITLDINLRNSINNDMLKKVLVDVQLVDFIENLPNGIHTLVGEKGSKLSGGQRQRLGIARALYTNPRLIVLDEATSALDSETENLLTEFLKSLHGKVTLIVIAHRLATVRNADMVCYVEEGTIRAKGNFEEVRSQVPDFDNQAKLLGL